MAIYRLYNLVDACIMSRHSTIVEAVQAAKAAALETNEFLVYDVWTEDDPYTVSQDEIRAALRELEK